MADEVKEEVENAANGGTEDGQRRERSKIAFPYGDLDDAVQVAKAVAAHHGMAQMDQLALMMDHETTESGAFRLKVATARIFGLIEIENERVKLTDLGNEIVHPESEARAKALAFIQVPLYRAIFEKYRGRLLPGNALLEEVAVTLGVAPKQKNRARQGFQRSAEQAKLGRDRLVLPPGVSLDSKPNEEGKGRKMENAQRQFTPSGDISPVLNFLLKSLPPSGVAWPRDARDQWMRMLELALDEMYKPSEE